MFVSLLPIVAYHSEDDHNGIHYINRYDTIELGSIIILATMRVYKVASVIGALFLSALLTGFHLPCATRSKVHPANFTIREIKQNQRLITRIMQVLSPFDHKTYMN